MKHRLSSEQCSKPCLSISWLIYAFRVYVVKLSSNSGVPNAAQLMRPVVPTTTLRCFSHFRSLPMDLASCPSTSPCKPLKERSKTYVVILGSRTRAEKRTCVVRIAITTGIQCMMSSLFFHPLLENSIAM